MKNLIKINNESTGFNEVRWKPSIEEVRTATVVFVTDGFKAQGYDGSTSKRLYYVSKNKTIYNKDQFSKFVMENPDELFMLVSDYKANEYDIWAFVDSTENNIQLTFFKFNWKTGTMVEIACMHNKPGTCIWDGKSITFDKEFVKKFEKNENSYSSQQDYWQMALKLKDSDACYHTTQNTFYIIGEDDYNGQKNTSNIMVEYLKLPGKTRIVSQVGYSGIYYEVSTGETAMKDITTRYGIRNSADTRDYNYRHIHFDDVFDEGADLDKATWERVSNHIKSALEGGAGNQERIGEYYNKVSIKTKPMIVISAPIGMHRRQTYHYIKGFLSNGTVDIVELARGELLMKDMTPVNCYYLCSNGKYARVSHNLYADIKNTMVGIEVDKVSFEEWNESKSMHPELLKAITAAGDAIKLEKVKLFNRVPFGALYLEHLIKGANYDLAENFAEYITERADNMNYVCGSLRDVLPGCNPDGTSLMKVMDMNKPCFDLLMTYSHSGTNQFIAAYKAIKRLIPGGIVTKESEKMFRQYMELYGMDWVEYRCRTGRTVNIIDYPAEIKSIYKMINKIRNAFPVDSYEPMRNYKEIVMAYFQFKDFGWEPADSQIFIEFGLGDLSETRKMIRDREHAANVALSIYEDKIDELAHQRAENHYAHRMNALNKMVSTQKMAKESESGLLKKYVITAPTQIYGEDVVGSIEKEGRDMRHCVYRSYAGQIAGGTYTVLYLRSAKAPEQSLVTIGITNEGRINQTFGADDSEITKEQAEAIVEWATQREGMVTFKSEHKDVFPGGWARGVNVPSLPEPDAEWLRKLAEIE